MTLPPKNSEAYASLARRLKEARLEAGFTQVRAARRLHKPQSFISKCESGERRVDVLELKAFAALYGKDLAFFDV